MTLLAKTLNWKGSFSFDKKMPEGMKNKLMNIDILKKLKWKPSYSLDKGIIETYEYYKKIIS